MLKFDGLLYSNDEIKNDFRKFIFDLGKCNEKSQSLSSVKCFVLIVYDETHPYLKKVLEDRDLWRALDKLTGPRLAVLAYKDETEDSTPVLGMMINTGKGFVGSDFGSNTLRFVKEVFGKSFDASDLPLFLVFGLNEKISDEVSFISIHSDSKDHMYTMLKDSVGKLGNHLMSYDESDFKNPSAAVEIAKDFLIKNVGGKVVANFIKQYGSSAIGFFTKFKGL